MLYSIVNRNEMNTIMFTVADLKQVKKWRLCYL